MNIENFSKKIRKIIFFEGKKGYEKPIPYFFETDCPYSIEQLEKITYEDGRGRMGCSLKNFIDKLISFGFYAKKLNRKVQYEDSPIETMYGSPGNY